LDAPQHESGSPITIANRRRSQEFKNGGGNATKSYRGDATLPHFMRLFDSLCEVFGVWNLHDRRLAQYGVSLMLIGRALC
jgi:hypothetical protein